jgi:hypothetical protein
MLRTKAPKIETLSTRDRVFRVVIQLLSYYLMYLPLGGGFTPNKDKIFPSEYWKLSVVGFLGVVGFGIGPSVIFKMAGVDVDSDWVELKGKPVGQLPQRKDDAKLDQKLFGEGTPGEDVGSGFEGRNVFTEKRKGNAVELQRVKNELLERLKKDE